MIPQYRMELSLFLAKLIGIYLLIAGALWFARRDAFVGGVEEMFASRAVMFLSGIIALIIGIAMAISHSVWELNWRGLVTLFGYLAIAKGVTRISFPDVPKKAAGMLRNGVFISVWLGLLLFLGAYLTWAGFTKG